MITRFEMNRKLGYSGCVFVGGGWGGGGALFYHFWAFQASGLVGRVLGFSRPTHCLGPRELSPYIAPNFASTASFL
jgi:hypothetical protein